MDEIRRESKIVPHPVHGQVREEYGITMRDGIIRSAWSWNSPVYPEPNPEFKAIMGDSIAACVPLAPDDDTAPPSPGDCLRALRALRSSKEGA